MNRDLYADPDARLIRLAEIAMKSHCPLSSASKDDVRLSLCRERRLLPGRRWVGGVRGAAVAPNAGPRPLSSSSRTA